MASEPAANVIAADSQTRLVLVSRSQTQARPGRAIRLRAWITPAGSGGNRPLRNPHQRGSRVMRLPVFRDPVTGEPLFSVTAAAITFTVVLAKWMIGGTTWAGHSFGLVTNEGISSRPG